MEIKTVTMIDISSPKTVEIRVSHDGKTLWVNVDEICVLRITRVPIMVVEDERNLQ